MILVSVWEPLEIILPTWRLKLGPQFSAQLVDYKCDSETLAEVLGVIDTIQIYIRKLLRFNFLSEQRLLAP